MRLLGLLALLSAGGSSSRRLALDYADLVVLLVVGLTERIERVWLIHDVPLLENLCLVDAPLLLGMPDFVGHFLESFLQYLILFPESISLRFVVRTLLNHLFQLHDALLQFANCMFMSLGF